MQFGFSFKELFLCSQWQQSSMRCDCGLVIGWTLKVHLCSDWPMDLDYAMQ